MTDLERALARIDRDMAAVTRWRGLSGAERRAEIEAYYARLARERVERFNAVHGEGAAERRGDEHRARPLPSFDMGPAVERAWDRFGYWEYGR
jgi:hypothetical protein